MTNLHSQNSQTRQKAAAHEELNSGDIARVVGGEKHTALVISSGVPKRALVDKTLRRRQTDTAAAGDKLRFSIELAHVRLSFDTMRPIGFFGLSLISESD